MAGMHIFMEAVSMCWTHADTYCYGCSECVTSPSFPLSLSTVGFSYGQALIEAGCEESHLGVNLVPYRASRDYN